MSASQAQALAYALEIGGADVAEARQWADAQIAGMEKPSDALLSLATERNLAVAVSLLHELGHNAEGESVGRLVYRWMLQAIRKGSLSHERAAEAIVRLARDAAAPSPEARDQSWHFDDAFYLARHEMYGTVAEVSAEVEEHLRKFAARHLAGEDA
jgi:hypothetical protein